MKKKSKAVALLWFMATCGFGGHRFYLGSKKVGLVYVAIFCALVFLLDGQVPDEPDGSIMILVLGWVALIVFDFFWVLLSKKPYEVQLKSEGSTVQDVPEAPASPVANSVSRAVEIETSRMENSVSDTTPHDGGDCAENISDPDPESLVESVPVPVPEPELEPEQGLTPAPQTEAEPTSKPVPELDLATELETESEPVAEPQAPEQLEATPDDDRELVYSEGLFADLDSIAAGKKIAYGSLTSFKRPGERNPANVGSDKPGGTSSKTEPESRENDDPN